MKVLLLTNEYPPHIYGGAGVHVDYLSRNLAKSCEVEVRCFGNQDLKEDSLSVLGFPAKEMNASSPKPLQSVWGTLQRCLDFNTKRIDADIVHVHTWYTHLGGILAKLNYSIPLVLTTHSLEPLRPWKREQLGGSYDFSCWVEKTAIEMADAVIAVSGKTKKDILKFFHVDEQKVHIIHNGIDPEEFRPVQAPEKLKKYGVDPAKPYLLFLGRITRQKGIIHFLHAIPSMHQNFQIVLCAGAPDTPEIAEEMQQEVETLKRKRRGIIWIEEMVDNATKVALFSHATVFCCSSVYEPFGIINLEAMACETPVVATATGGIPEVVVEGKTGLLVPIRQDIQNTFEPLNPQQFSKDLAERINTLMADPKLCQKMGKSGRQRILEMFSWETIAQKTHTLYQSLLS